MLVLDGYESHINTKFDKYYKANNIVLLCLPVYSLHLTQPLDISVFSRLKNTYGKQISNLT